jgi:hypothetical protein
MFITYTKTCPCNEHVHKHENRCGHSHGHELRHSLVSCLCTYTSTC